MKKLLSGLLALAMLAAPALAQAPPTPAPTSVIVGQVALSVSNSSSSVALPSTAKTALSITIYNKGTVDAYYALGGSSVAATTSSFQIPAGTYQSLWISSNTYLAAITASSTTSLVIYQSNGPIQFGQVGTGSSGGGTPSGPAGGDLASTYPNPTVVNGSNITNSSIPNSGLVNPATTVNGQSCALGSTCTLPNGSASVFGTVKVDNTTITASGGVIAAVSQGLTGTGYPTAACSAGQTFLATDTRQNWVCDNNGVWTNQTTGIPSTGNAAYNTGLLARYRVSDATASGTNNLPDTSGNGNNGAFGNGGAPYYGAAPVIDAGVDINTSTGGQAFNTTMQVILPAAAVTGMHTFLIFYTPSTGGASPQPAAGTLLGYNGDASTYGSTYSTRSSDGTPVIGNDGGGYNTTTAPMQQWQGVVPVTYTLGATPHIYYQGKEVIGYALQTASPTSPTGGTYASLLSFCCAYANGFLGKMYYMETYSGTLTQAQISSESARINAELYGRGVVLGNQLNVNKPIMTWLGTSITEGFSAGSTVGYFAGTTNYAALTAAAFGGFFQNINGGLGGNTLTSQVTLIQTSMVNPVANRWPPIVFLDFPTNDIVGNSGTVTTAETNLQTSCAAIKAAGGIPLAATVLPSTVSGSSSTFSANRAAWNTWVRANAQTYCAGFADPASDPTIGPDSAASNATYYNTDGRHPTAAGDAIAAVYYEAAVTKVTGMQPIAGAACVSGTSPAVCGSAVSGIVAIPTGTDPTLVVNTTAVTNINRVLLTIDQSLGTALGVTCNTTLLNNVQPFVSARTNRTSFTAEVPATVASNPICVSWSLVN